MLSSKMQQALNDQIQKELYSSYMYISMAAHFQSKNLPGAANWMRIQQGEEMEHAMKFFDFVHDRGGQVILQAIPQPPSDFSSPVVAFKEALAHEQKVTQSIHDLYALAVQEKDYPTQVMLQWFIDEQVEEERNATDVVAQLELVGDSPAGLYMVDRALGSREAE